MSKLSLCEINQSQLDKTPIIDGQLVVCLDTGNVYRDSKTAHVKIGSDLEVVSELPLAPLANKIYFLRPNSLYIYSDGEWVSLGGTNTWRGIQNNLTSDSTEDSLSAAQGKILKELVDKKPDEMKLYPITIPANGWSSDDQISYPYYIDISIDGIKESDCIAVVISPDDVDAAQEACFTTTESRTNLLRLRARNIPKSDIGAFYYFVREDIVKAFGFENYNISPYTLPIATSNLLGGIKIGPNFSMSSDGVMSLVPATENVLGGIKVGNNLSISEDGVLSAPTPVQVQYGTSAPDNNLPDGSIYIVYEG